MTSKRTLYVIQFLLAIVNCRDFYACIEVPVPSIPQADTYRGTVIQTMNYYPFGAEFCDGTTKNDIQKHKYNGKEFDNMHGLNTYDYGARQYNPVTARWDRMDPLAEKYYSVSPYNYCHNNPVMMVDPDGKDDYTVNGDGNMYNSTSLWEKFKTFIGMGCEQDRVFMEGQDQPIATMPDGTITLKQNDNNLTQVEIKNDKFAEKFTDAVMKNTNVECARVKHGTDESTSNTIQNNHKDNDVSTAAETMNNYVNKGETIYMFDHSHPVPKGVTNGLETIQVSRDDMKTVSTFKPIQNRVFNKQKQIIEYYDSKRVYKNEKWK